MFASIDVVRSTLPICAGIITTMKIDTSAVNEKMDNEFLFATDLAEYLMKKGVSHPDAHGAVGKLVTFCVEKGRKISSLDVTTLRRFSPKFGKDAYRLLDKDVSVAIKRVSGGTSPGNVKRQIAKWHRRLG